MGKTYQKLDKFPQTLSIREVYEHHLVFGFAKTKDIRVDGKGWSAVQVKRTKPIMPAG
jgi:hypothetical protein